MEKHIWREKTLFKTHRLTHTLLCATHKHKWMHSPSFLCFFPLFSVSHLLFLSAFKIVLFLLFPNTCLIFYPIALYLNLEFASLLGFVDRKRFHTVYLKKQALWCLFLWLFGERRPRWKLESLCAFLGKLLFRDKQTFWAKPFW